MRTFTNPHALVVDRRWRTATGAADHIVQFDVLLVAPTKAAGVALLVGVGMVEHAATSLVKSLRQAPSLSVGWRMAVDAGSLRLDEPGLYVTRGPVNGVRVARVMGPRDDDVVVLGEFGYDRQAGRLTYAAAPVTP